MLPLLPIKEAAEGITADRSTLVSQRSVLRTQITMLLDVMSKEPLASC